MHLISIEQIKGMSNLPRITYLAITLYVSIIAVTPSYATYDSYIEGLSCATNSIDVYTLYPGPSGKISIKLLGLAVPSKEASKWPNNFFNTLEEFLPLTSILETHSTSTVPYKRQNYVTKIPV